MRQNRFLTPSRLSWVVFFILSLTPIFFYFGYLAAYGVNVPLWDDWEIVSLMGHFYAGNLKFAHLWAQHNENRMLIPNLIFIALYRLTAFNVKAAMVASGIFLTLAFVCFTYIFLKRHSLNWKFVPLAYLFFNLADTQNILWGFQMAWQWISFCFFGCILCLEESGNSQKAFATAVLFAILASFSSLQGLFVWLAGFIYLLFNDFSPRQKKIWISTALICGIIYFTGFNFHSTGGPPIFYAFNHPLSMLEYLSMLLGRILLFPNLYTYAGNTFFIAREFAGFSLFLIGLFSTAKAFMESRRNKALLLPASLGTFSLLFCVSATIGRTGFGLEQALETRYALYGIFLLISIYLTLLEMIKTRREELKLIFRFFLLLLIIQIGYSLQWGIFVGQGYLNRGLKGQEILINYKAAYPNLISHYLYYPHPQKVIPRAAILEKHRLNIFANWKAHTLLPAPESLKRLFQKRPTDWLIWKLLSTIYFYRPDLQEKYPPIPSEKKFAQEIASWADRRGITDDQDRIFLIPWKAQILQINRALK